MISRITLAVCLASGLAASALMPPQAEARSRGERSAPIVRSAGGDRSELTEQLSDPMTQVKVAAMAAMMSQMLLDLKVGPPARAMGDMGVEDARSVSPDARLGDIAGPGARDMPRQIAREVPGAMRKMGAASGAFEEMIPEFEAMAEKMRRAMAQAGYPSRR